jgi:hypothetical protein
VSAGSGCPVGVQSSSALTSATTSSRLLWSIFRSPSSRSSPAEGASLVRGGCCMRHPKPLFRGGLWLVE